MTEHSINNIIPTHWIISRYKWSPEAIEYLTTISRLLNVYRIFPLLITNNIRLIDPLFDVPLTSNLAVLCHEFHKEEDNDIITGHHILLYLAWLINDAINIAVQNVNNYNHAEDYYPLTVLASLFNTKITDIKLIGQAVRNLPAWKDTVLPMGIYQLGEEPLAIPLTDQEEKLFKRYIGSNKLWYVRILINGLKLFTIENPQVLSMHEDFAHFKQVLSSGWLSLILLQA